MNNNATRQLMTASLLLALGLLLPTLTMQLPEFGSKLLPMHIPVLICGFLLDWKYGLLVGFLTPILRSLLFGMPPIYPTAIAMAVELAVYGTAASLLYKHSKKDIISIYISLIASMIIGRVMWGITMMTIMSISQSSFTFSMFFAGAVMNALPGILLQLILIPALICTIQKAKRS